MDALVVEKLLECSYIENVITKKLLNKYGFF